jgi:hypothetical protein
VQPSVLSVQSVVRQQIQLMSSFLQAETSMVTSTSVSSLTGRELEQTAQLSPQE